MYKIEFLTFRYKLTKSFAIFTAHLKTIILQNDVVIDWIGINVQFK